MELEKYQTLVCAIETGSLSAAAASLHYTASGISRVISALENEVGFPLLVRKHEGVIPTPECEALLPAIRELLFSGETCMKQAALIRGLEVGTVTVGTAYSVYYGLLSEIIGEFRKEHPGIVIQLMGGFSSRLAAQVEQRRIDLCIISRRDGDFIWHPLQDDDLVAWLPEHHPNALQESVPHSLFRTEHYIDIFPGEESDNSRFFKENRLRPKTMYTTTDSHSACAMVEAGLGITLNNALNSLGRSMRMKVVPLSPRQTIEIGIAVRRGASPAVEKFVKRVIAMMRNFQ